MHPMPMKLYKWGSSIYIFHSMFEKSNNKEGETEISESDYIFFSNTKRVTKEMEITVTRIKE